MRKKILILDDNKDILEAMKEALTYSDFDVEVAEGTTDIFTLIDDYHPNMLMLDYLLWETTGAELCRQIKTNAGTASLPVILFSAYPSIFERSEIAYCDAVLPKPFDLSELLATVNSCMS